MEQTFEFSAHGLTHRGNKREVNADHFLVAQIHRSLRIVESSINLDKPEGIEVGPGGHLLIVADGVGGGSGEEASELAVERMLKYISGAMQFSRTDISLEQDLLKEFTAAICASHERLVEESEAGATPRTMATTLTMVYVLGLRAYVGHVGDSRCYLVREGNATRITKDQTYAQMLIDQGLLSETKARGSRLSHVLSSAVGGKEDAQPSVLTYVLTLRKEDILILCTDGLTKHVTDQEIGSMVAGDVGTSEACNRFLDTALQRGGSDNVTVIVGRFAASR